MRTYEIHVGIGPVRLGMSRPESREAMDPPYDTFEKVAGSGQWVAAYLDSTFQVFFKARGDIVESVELSSWEHFGVTLDGLSVFQTPADELISQINEHADFDPDDPELDYSCCFPGLGMWLLAAPSTGT